MRKAFQRYEMSVPEVKGGSKEAGVELGIQIHWRRKSLGPLYKIPKKMFCTVI